MGTGPSEDHQDTAYHPALRHAQDVSEVLQPPLADRTQKVEHWRCSRVPIVLVSDDMQASAVAAVDTAHHCSSRHPEGHRLRRNHHTGVLPPNTRKSARSRGQYRQHAPGRGEPPQRVS